jgi:hypothetical protein
MQFCRSPLRFWAKFTLSLCGVEEQAKQATIKKQQTSIDNYVTKTKSSKVSEVTQN